MHELSITRFIAAPPDEVWEVMANRQEEWFCPAPWRAEIIAQDRRPGGRCDMVFHGPDGEAMPQSGIYLAWDEGRRFVTTDAFDAQFNPTGPFMVGSWSIAANEDNGVTGTLYTASARHWTDDARRQHEEMGFEQGWGVCADALALLCTA